MFKQYRCHRVLSSAGFTLVEILVSFTLMSIVLTMMYAGISAVHRASGKGEARIDMTNQIRSVHTFVRRQLHGMLPINLQQDTVNQSKQTFIGSDQRLQFVATMPGYLRRGGVYKQTLELVEDNNELMLRFSYEPINSLDNGFNSEEPVILLTGLKDVRFHYRGRDENQWLGSWQDFWDKPATMPSLVRIQLTFSDDSDIDASWPTLIVAPARVY